MAAAFAAVLGVVAYLIAIVWRVTKSRTFAAIIGFWVMLLLPTGLGALPSVPSSAAL